MKLKKILFEPFSEHFIKLLYLLFNINKVKTYFYKFQFCCIKKHNHAITLQLKWVKRKKLINQHKIFLNQLYLTK